jgi:hypothetical protein
MSSQKIAQIVHHGASTACVVALLCCTIADDCVATWPWPWPVLKLPVEKLGGLQLPALTPAKRKEMLQQPASCCRRQRAQQTDRLAGPTHNTACKAGISYSSFQQVSASSLNTHCTLILLRPKFLEQSYAVPPVPAGPAAKCRLPVSRPNTAGNAIKRFTQSHAPVPAGPAARCRLPVARPSSARLALPSGRSDSWCAARNLRINNDTRQGSGMCVSDSMSH